LVKIQTLSKKVYWQNQSAEKSKPLTGI